jgi:beta-phosphoglucomutase-like phosphatase (HAD superfamily)
MEKSSLQPPSPPALIFDVDGVLLASPHERAWQASLERLMTDRWRDLAPASSYAPERFSTAVYQEFVAGKPRESGAQAALEFFRIPDAAARAEEYGRVKQAMIEELIDGGEFSAFPDALRLVATAWTRKIPMAAASSSKNANAMMVQVDVAVNGDTMRLTRMFAANVCGRDVPRGKPFPDLFLLAAEELDVPGDICIVIEDAPAGVEAAKAAGMRAIGIARLDDEDLLRQAGADLVVTSLDVVAVDALAEGRLQIEASTPQAYQD